MNRNDRLYEQMTAAIKLGNKISGFYPPNTMWIGFMFLEEYIDFIFQKDANVDTMLEVPYEAMCDGILAEGDYEEFRSHFSDEIEAYFKDKEKEA